MTNGPFAHAPSKWRHDMKNQLGIVLGFVDLLMQETDPADPRRADIRVCPRHVKGIAGHELARQLRFANPNLKVLYLTGHTDHLFDAKDHMWDSEAFLEKPFSVNSLRQAVALLLVGRLKF